MTSSSSRFVVLAAIGANALIAVTKFVAAYVTGSGAMTSEGFHSVVDSGNSALILVGMRLARRPASARHPFGHSKELYFWTLIVAILIFGLGAGFSAYEGVEHLRHPVEIANPLVSYGVLAAALVFETISFAVAAREFQAHRRSRRRMRGVVETIRTSKDPALYSVLLEDFAALAGLFIALAGVAAAHLLGIAWADGAASLGIGALLGLIALFLIYESRGLLLGEAADPDVVAELEAFARKDPAVHSVPRVLTMHLGPDDVLLNMTVVFRPGLPAEEIVAALDRLEDSIKRNRPEFRHVFIDLDALTRADAGH